jgi:hypothetical protein
MMMGHRDRIGLAILTSILALAVMAAGIGAVAPRAEVVEPDQPTLDTAEGSPGRLRVDPNTAPPFVLGALPGLGPTLVADWVAARRERPFNSPSDLCQRVRRLGPVTYRRIEPHLVFPTLP